MRLEGYYSLGYHEFYLGYMEQEGTTYLVIGYDLADPERTLQLPSYVAIFDKTNPHSEIDFEKLISLKDQTVCVSVILADCYKNSLDELTKGSQDVIITGQIKAIDRYSEIPQQGVNIRKR